MAITDQPDFVTHPVPTSASTPAPDVDARAPADRRAHLSASPYGVTERVKEKVAGAFKSNGED